MDILICAACARPLTDAVRLMDAVPDLPPWDGSPGPDGLRRSPATMPRGRYAVQPDHRGAPFVPCPEEDEDAYDGIHPGGPWASDERGWLVSAGPRNQYVLHLDDVLPLDLHPEPLRSSGCCGAAGADGPNRVCACGAEVATLYADCSTPYEILFAPGAVRVVPAPRPGGPIPDHPRSCRTYE
ncbi:hypothetical protein [Streptomyces roseoviridis]|uniref:Cysteine-rich CPCC domain-containing protein n=1 Tax=Streptomyces roseoviridis TaxID=67361 RepID=A0ABV5QXW6_9ACTN